MKKLLWLLVVPVAAVPGQALAGGCGPLAMSCSPFCGSCSGGGCGKGCGSNCCGFGLFGNFNLNATCPQAGPWYTYWPLEAHFNTAAPHGLPGYPPPMGSPEIPYKFLGGMPAGPAPVAMPPAGYCPAPAPQPVPHAVAPAMPQQYQPVQYQPVQYQYQPVQYQYQPASYTYPAPQIWFNR